MTKKKRGRTIVPKRDKNGRKIPFENVEIKYDPDNLDDVNKIRKLDGHRKIKSLYGYCMSSGCSCDEDTKPICGQFKSYDATTLKKTSQIDTLSLISVNYSVSGK